VSGAPPAGGSPSVAGVVLAAGLARRFGGGKLAAPLDGRPLVGHVLDTVRSAVKRRLLATALAVVASGPALGSPNGITWQDTTGVWLLAPLQSPGILSWSEGDSMPRVVATGPGGYDGIEALRDGRVLVTSWADSAVHLITHGRMTKLIANVDAPADLGYDLKRGVVAVPRFRDNKVDYFQLKAGS